MVLPSMKSQSISPPRPLHVHVHRSIYCGQHTILLHILLHLYICHRRMRKICTSTENRRNRFHIMINSFPTCNTSRNRFSVSKDRMSFASIKTSPVIAFSNSSASAGFDSLYTLNCSFHSFSFSIPFVSVH